MDADLYLVADRREAEAVRALTGTARNALTPDDVDHGALLGRHPRRIYYTDGFLAAPGSLMVLRQAHAFVAGEVLHMDYRARLEESPAELVPARAFRWGVQREVPDYVHDDRRMRRLEEDDARLQLLDATHEAGLDVYWPRVRIEWTPTWGVQGRAGWLLRVDWHPLPANSRDWLA